MNASPLLVKIARLDKIIKSKKTLGRPRDLAVIEILERTLDEKKRIALKTWSWVEGATFRSTARLDKKSLNV